MPSQRVADAGRVRVVAPAHLVARLRPAAAEDPAAACGAAVVAQLAEARELLALLAQHLGRIGILESASALPLNSIASSSPVSGSSRLDVRPGQIEDGIGELAAVLR
jgi:hypothetical protein